MDSTVCEQCGKIFRYKPSASRGRFCSRACFGLGAANVARERKGWNHPWQKASDGDLLEAWKRLKEGKFITIGDLGSSLGYARGNPNVGKRLRKLVGGEEYDLETSTPRMRRRRYPEDTIRRWFEKWKKSRRPLGELRGEGMPHPHTMGKLFREYLPVEYEDAVESKKGRGYQIGRAFEYRCRDWLKAKGYLVFRSAKSLGPADLIAMKSGQILLIQAKTRKDSFGKDEKEVLCELGVISGGIPILAWRGRWGEGIHWEAMDGSSFENWA